MLWCCCTQSYHYDSVYKYTHVNLCHDGVMLWSCCTVLLFPFYLQIHPKRPSSPKRKFGGWDGAVSYHTTPTATTAPPKSPNTTRTKATTTTNVPATTTPNSPAKPRRRRTPSTEHAIKIETLNETMKNLTHDEHHTPTKVIAINNKRVWQ